MSSSTDPVLPRPASLGTPVYGPAFTTVEGERLPATIHFADRAYPELDQAGAEWWRSLNNFSVAVDGSRLDERGMHVPIPGGARHRELETFHDGLKLRINDTSLAEPRTPFWNAQATIEGLPLRPIADGTRTANPATLDEMMQQYMTHVPTETEALVRASERRYALQTHLDGLHLEELRRHTSIHDLHTDFPGLLEAAPQPTLQELVAGRETLLQQAQRELEYIRSNLARIVAFRSTNPPEPTPVTPPIAPVVSQAPAGGGGGYYGGGYGGAEQAVEATTAAGRAEGQVAHMGSRWGIVAAVVGLGAVVYAMAHKSKKDVTKDVTEKKPSQPSRG